MKNKDKILVSIIITNYNYSKYIRQCIESCLNQTYKNIEIIVVDDGSTDNSKEVLKLYENLLLLILQKNKGMVEASNTGYRHSKGDLIMFLDADDYLFRNAIEKVVKKWQHGSSKLHFKLQKVNENGDELSIFPKLGIRLDEGEVWKKILNKGNYINVPTSGNIYSKSILEKFFPILDASISNTNSYFDKIPTDAYLKMRIPFFGHVIAIQDALGAYRIHGKNNGAISSPYFNEKKRNRVLTLAYLNMNFIKRHTFDKKIKWNPERIFSKNKLFVLRILSYRFNYKNHHWKDDTKYKLFISSLFLTLNVNIARSFYNLFINVLLLFLNEKNSINLLKFIKPKRHQKI